MSFSSFKDGTFLVHVLNCNASIQTVLAFMSTYLLLKQSRPAAADRVFYVAKELLMTERTYKKDLEVITRVSVDVVASNRVC